MEQIEQIRQAYYREGKSIRQIARELHHSRKVVAEALQDATPRQYTLQRPRPSPVLASVIPIVDQWLLEDQQRPKKQRHTAHRIWQLLHDEYRFPGAESTVRCYVREHCPISDGARAQLAMIPLAYPPGQEAQADFYEAQVIMDGALTVAHACAVRLCYSKLPLSIRGAISGLRSGQN